MVVQYLFPGKPLAPKGHLNNIFIKFIFPALYLIIKLQAVRAIAHLTYHLLYIAATLGLIPICTIASTTSLTLIYMLAMLGIYILIKGVSKIQHYSFISLNFILSAAATLGLTPICIIASCTGLLLICINTSYTSFTLILICTNASHTKCIQAFLV